MTKKKMKVLKQALKDEKEVTKNLNATVEQLSKEMAQVKA